jgi:hypothetical protein
MLYTHTLNSLVIFYTVYLLYTFTISIIMLIFYQYMYNIYVKLNIDNLSTAGINYKELYDCKWDPITLTNITLYTPAFKYFCPMMACIGRN